MLYSSDNLFPISIAVIASPASNLSVFSVVSDDPSLYNVTVTVA